jgi:hypothetical protein
MDTKKVAALGVTLLLFAIADSALAGGPIVALFDMEDRGSTLDPAVVQNLTDLLAAQLAEGGFQVVPRDQVRQRLLQTKVESYKECYDQTCQIELGRELAAEKVVSTKIIRIGDKCQLMAELYDLRKSATDGAATSEKACLEQSLVLGIREVSQKLCATLRGPAPEPSAPNEFDLFLLEAKKQEDEKARAEQAWSIIQRISGDAQQPTQKRIDAVRKYLQEFPQGPRTGQANAALASLLATLPARLTVVTEPGGAQIFLNGQAVARSPTTLDLTQGGYDLRVELDGYFAGSQRIAVKPGEASRVAVVLRKILPGRLSIQTSPEGASVAIDGQPRGNAPLVAELMPGEHELSLEQAGHHPARRRVVIEAEQQRAATIELHAIPPDYSSWGHAAFWPGLALLALGGAGAGLSSGAADDYAHGDRGAADTSRTWAGVMWGGFVGGAALTLTGVVLWALSGDDYDPARDDDAMLSVTPTADGASVGLSGRW